MRQLQDVILPPNKGQQTPWHFIACHLFVTAPTSLKFEYVVEDFKHLQLPKKYLE